MKKLKKLAGILLALVVVFSMTAPAYAETVENKTTHSYDVYQIFSGTQETTGIPLGDAEWGSGINGDAFLPALQADSRFVDATTGKNIFANCKTALDVAGMLNGKQDNSDIAKAFADVAAGHLKTKCTSIAGVATVELDPGYYLLVDTSTLVDGDARNSALLQVTHRGDITIEKKYSVPAVDKYVKDTDDNWVKAVDLEFGSTVEFQLTGTLPQNYSDYKEYKYVFHDTLSSGLKYKGDAKVYLLNGTTKTALNSGFTVEPSAAAATGGGTLTVTFSNIKNIAAVNADSKIIVEYSAELLNTATIGSTGNSNKVKLEYSNDPNTTADQSTSTSNTTPEDEIKVFTYELDVIKVDSTTEAKKLANAKFVLLNSDKTKAAKVTDGKFESWENVTTAADGTVTYPDGTVLTSDNDGKVVIKGLDAGSYYLRETKAPAGYNTLKDDIALVITATLDKTKEGGGPNLRGLTLKVGSDDPESFDVAQGIVSTNVKNNAGAQLPETGGMGTTLFYIVGAALVLSAVVLLVTKKRMSGAEK